MNTHLETLYLQFGLCLETIIILFLFIRRTVFKLELIATNALWIVEFRRQEQFQWYLSWNRNKKSKTF